MATHATTDGYSTTMAKSASKCGRSHTELTTSANSYTRVERYCSMYKAVSSTATTYGRV